MTEKLLVLNKTVKIAQNIHVNASVYTKKRGKNEQYAENK